MKYRLTSLALMLLLALPLKAQNERNLLTGKIDLPALSRQLIPVKDWHPYPTAADTTKRAQIPAAIQSNYIHQAEGFADRPWEILAASAFLDFARNGNRSRYEAAFFARRQRLTSLVLAEWFENHGRFMDDIVNGVWALCEESFWGVPAHMGLQQRGPGLPDVTEPVVDLFAAETGALLAWTDYLLGEKLDRVSPLVRERIQLEIEKRIILPYLQRNDFWWMGFTDEKGLNNWNPWINSNVLNCVLLVEKDADRRAQAVYKTMVSVDKFLNGYPNDGGCDEGPGYWGRAGGSVFDYLNLLFLATDGKINIFEEPLIRNMGQFIYKAWIQGDYYVNFADASALNQPEAGLVYRYGAKIHDPVMTGFGAFLARRQYNGSAYEDPDDGSLVRVLPDLLVINEMAAVTPVEPFVFDFWLPGLQVMGARSHKDSNQGFYVAAKGGNNDESHNHNDVGNFIVYADGRPVLIDIGVETYSAKTFSDARYDIWTMQSQYHNLPTINGIQQKDGPSYRAGAVHYNATPKRAELVLDLAKAYPPEARVASWLRTLNLERGRAVILKEDYRLTEFREPVRLNLMTSCIADVSVPGRVILTDSSDSTRRFLLAYNPAVFTVTAELKPVEDVRLTPVWGNRLIRLVLTIRNKALEGSYQITLTKID
jgi:hypothetical protein